MKNILSQNTASKRRILRARVNLNRKVRVMKQRAAKRLRNQSRKIRESKFQKVSRIPASYMSQIQKRILRKINKNL